tara:strand:- start:3234 stop:3512 length:279 start_codon:yes stop_codon:yes gene_type:complete
MAYKIKKQQYALASNHNVSIKPSQNKNKKIDVFKDKKLVASIGAKGYKDFATYIEEKGITYAKERRRLYRIRHKGENLKIGSPGYYAWYLLW